MKNKKEITFVENGVKKKCIIIEKDDSTQWLQRVNAGVQTHSYHLTSTSEGELFIHRDDLDEKGLKVGQEEKWYATHSEYDLGPGEEFDYTPTDNATIFPQTEGIEITSIASSQRVISKKQNAKVLVVEYQD